MSRSKLELYVDILDALVAYGPLKVTWIILKARVNYAQLKPLLNNMITKGFVKEKTLEDGSVVFEATRKGRVNFVDYKRYSKLDPIFHNAQSFRCELVAAKLS